MQRHHICLGQTFSTQDKVNVALWLVLIMKQTVSHTARFVAKPYKQPAEFLWKVADVRTPSRIVYLVIYFGG